MGFLVSKMADFDCSGAGKLKVVAYDGLRNVIGVSSPLVCVIIFAEVEILVLLIKLILLQ